MDACTLTGPLEGSSEVSKQLSVFRCEDELFGTVFSFSLKMLSQKSTNGTNKWDLSPLSRFRFTIIEFDIAVEGILSKKMDLLLFEG